MNVVLEKQFHLRLNNPEIYILKRNCFNRHLVDNYAVEKKAVSYKTPNRVTDFDEITKHRSINLMIVFIAKENEQVCSTLLETKKEYLIVQENVFSFDSIETDDRIIKHEGFLGSKDVKLLFAGGEIFFVICFIKGMFLII